jgi:hypothetical protein
MVAALPPLMPVRHATSYAQLAAVSSVPPPRSISVPPQILNPAQLAMAYAALPPLHRQFNSIQTSVSKKKNLSI